MTRDENFLIKQYKNLDEIKINWYIKNVEGRGLDRASQILMSGIFVNKKEKKFIPFVFIIATGQRERKMRTFVLPLLQFFHLLLIIYWEDVS